ncbi:MAG: dihydropteroate synthase [Candidatus Hodarchaeaceae archaeon]|nr:dihydropteroate synthase [Candidatus Hodarchaeaceae archaeon]
MAMAKLGKVEIADGGPAVIIAVLNLSPDSFYRESIVCGGDAAVKRASEMVEQGASVIDVGAMGTGPRSKPISAERERHELIPIIRALARELDIPISADTQRAEIAEAAIGAGATVVNDISGLKADPQMAEVIARAGCSALLMATKHAPGDVYKIEEIKRALKGSLNICREHGISLNRVVIDPAIGYWPARLARLGLRARRPLKGQPYNLATLLDLRILARLGELKSLNRPICVGISRKSFIGGVLDLPRPEDRLIGSLAATAIAVLNGASVVRTHDVRETLQAVRLAEAIRNAGGRG